jgi:2-oxoglutarate ferredoxin oxidoreductase subunit delta
MKYWRTPLDIDKIKIPKGEIHILRERCKGCGFCVQYCPKDVLALSKGFNKKGYHPPEVVDPDACVHCELCQAICPEFAIYCLLVQPVEEE